MPTDVAVIVVGIVLVFGAFAASLAWAYHHTGKARQPGAGE